MKKIKSTHQLQAEKKRIKQRKLDSETKVRESWASLKASLKPAAIAGNTLNCLLTKGAASSLATDNIFRNTFTYAVTVMAQKLSEKAEEKFAAFFKKQ